MEILHVFNRKKHRCVNRYFFNRCNIFYCNCSVIFCSTEEKALTSVRFFKILPLPTAAKELQVEIKAPNQYERGWNF